MNNKDTVVHICMISDDNYVMPTCVALQSFLLSKKESFYHIHIVASSLSSEAEQQFLQFTADDVKIDIVRENAEKRFGGFHTFDSHAVCVASISALLKFILPDLFPEIDKLLYLDGDLVSKIDLGELYQTDLSENYAAVIIDSGSIYYRHTYVKKVQNYFNSGVLLLNLKKMREDHVPELLLKTKKELSDSSLMDQNVFNLVFDGKVRLLPIRYNFMPVSLTRAYSKWTIQNINQLYGTSYENKKQLFADAAIIHYSSKDKPWKDPDGACASDWIHCYLKTPMPHPLFPQNEPQEEAYGISVIIPCFNVENYIRETMDSVLNQTFQDFEVLCMDDGSTDHTLEILQEYQAKHSNIRVFANTNHRQGYERNMGIRNACGKYLYYMDSDDLLKENCLETIYICAEENRLDLLYFEGTSFYETPELEEQYPDYKILYRRRDAHPKVYSGDELYLRFREMGGLIVSPCLQFARRDYIINHFLYFPELPMLEDNLYTFRTLLTANRVKCLGDVLFYRRVRGNSTMTAEKGQEKTASLMVLLKETSRELHKYEKGSPMYLAISKHLQIYYKVLANTEKLLEEEYFEPWEELTWEKHVNGPEKEWLFSSLYAESAEFRMQQMTQELNQQRKQLAAKDREITQLKNRVKALETKYQKHL